MQLMLNAHNIGNKKFRLRQALKITKQVTTGENCFLWINTYKKLEGSI